MTLFNFRNCVLLKPGSTKVGDHLDHWGGGGVAVGFAVYSNVVGALSAMLEPAAPPPPPNSKERAHSLGKSGTPGGGGTTRRVLPPSPWQGTTVVWSPDLGALVLPSRRVATGGSPKSKGFGYPLTLSYGPFPNPRASKTIIATCPRY